MSAVMLCGATITTYAADYSYWNYDEPENSGDYAYYGPGVVRSKNTTKDEVRWIQAAINYCIAYKGLNASYLSVDGSFGPASKAATKKFQSRYNLSDDGSFGPATIKKMKDVLRPNNEVKNFLQIGQTWSSKVYGTGNIKDTGCGILSIVNAVYNLNGKFIHPETLASWAHSAGHYNRVGYDRGSWATLFSAAAKKYGSSYGFSCAYSGNGKASDSRLKNHIINGGTAVVHVPGHFMAIVDYDASTGKYLVLDSAPNSGRRKGLTSENNCWKTANELSTGNLKVDRYYLYSKA